MEVVLKMLVFSGTLFCVVMSTIGICTLMKIRQEIKESTNSKRANNSDDTPNCWRQIASAFWIGVLVGETVTLILYLALVGINC